MDGSAAEGIRLADPAAPTDPEAAARALGELLVRRHGDGPAGGGTISLERYGAQLAALIESQPDETMQTGPYLGRSRRELGRLAVETVEALGQRAEPFAGIVVTLTLDDVRLRRDGTLQIVGELVRSDRHLEIARAAVGLATRFGTAVVAPFLDAYGLDRIDLRRLDTCQLLSMLADDVGFRPTVEGP